MLRRNNIFFKNKCRKVNLGVVHNVIGQLPKREKIDLTGSQFCPQISDASEPRSRKMKFFNPDAPRPISPQERDIYVLRICITAHHECDLRAIDPRINHDKPWGKRDWDKGAPAATSFEIPAIYKDEIIAKLRQNTSIIFAKEPLEFKTEQAYKSCNS